MVIRQTFSQGESPWIELFDSAGSPLPDGSYRWQLQLRPDAETANQLRQEATRNDGEAPGRWRPQSGHFRVLNGSLIDPEETELGASTERAEVRDTFIGGKRAGFGSRSESDSDEADRPEAEVQAEAAMAPAEAVSSFGSGLPGQSRIAGSDADGGVASEVIRQEADEAREPIPSRSIEPGGKNGRPTSEENDN